LSKRHSQGIAVDFLNENIHYRLHAFCRSDT